MGNIGAVARSMLNMGLNQLTLVNPRKAPDEEAYGLASGAGEVLDTAQVTSSLNEAIADCDFIIGTSARIRKVGLPMYTAQQAAESIATGMADNQIHQSAILFGRERTGLYNDELMKCNAHMYIPANADYNSLNLAQAVQVVAYQLRITMLAMEQADGLPAIPAGATSEMAGPEQLEGFYDHLQRMLIETGFLNPENPGLVMERVKSVFQRARLNVREVNLFRGICCEAIRAAQSSK